MTTKPSLTEAQPPKPKGARRSISAARLYNEVEKFTKNNDLDYEDSIADLFALLTKEIVIEALRK